MPETNGDYTYYYEEHDFDIDYDDLWDPYNFVGVAGDTGPRDTGNQGPPNVEPTGPRGDVDRDRVATDNMFVIPSGTTMQFMEAIEPRGEGFFSRLLRDIKENDEAERNREPELIMEIQC